MAQKTPRLEDSRFPAAPIPRQKRSDLVVQQIRRWIVRNRMQPGDPLPRERELIDMLGAGRGTVREALSALEYQGLVEVVPGSGGGARVSSIAEGTASEFLRNYFYFENLSWAQIYELREMIEPRVARSAAGNLDEHQLAELEASVATCAEGEPRSDAERRGQRQAELDFHRILMDACPNPLMRFIGNFINELLADFAAYRDVIEPESERFRHENLEAHRGLIEALRNGDASRAEALMHAHIHDAGCFLSAREAEIERQLLLQTRRES